MRVYDKRELGQPKWPIWWEEDYDPDNFGNVCVICQREMHYSQNSMAASGFDWDAGEYDNDFGSGFCVCLSCLMQCGRKPSDPTIDRHDRSVLQRFSAVYRTLVQEIKNERAKGWRTIGAVQSGWAHYGHHQ